ncbi:hypothetical protein D3C80_1541250 [compost metagenome]
MWQVRNGQQQRVQLGLDRVQLLLGRRQLAPHALDVGHQRGNILAALLGLADPLGTGVTLGLQLFGAGLGFLAPAFQRLEARYIQLKTASRQTLGHFLRLATNQFGVEHGEFSFSRDSRNKDYRTTACASRKGPGHPVALPVVTGCA